MINLVKYFVTRLSEEKNEEQLIYAIGLLMDFKAHEKPGGISKNRLLKEICNSRSLRGTMLTDTINKTTYAFSHLPFTARARCFIEAIYVILETDDL